MRKFVLAAVAAVLFAVPAFAKFGVRPGWTRAYVLSASRPQVEAIVSAAGSELLWIYSDRALVYTPSLQTLTAKALEHGTTATPARDVSDTFSVNDVRVDPENDVPAEDDFSQYSTLQGLYVLQFAGPYDPAMAAELAARGATVVPGTTTSNNARIVQTADPRKLDALPWLAYRDFLHPRFKNVRRHVDPDRYYAAEFRVASTAPDANRIAQQLALPSYAGTGTLLNFLGRDVTALFAHPLVHKVSLSPSLIDIYGVLPAQGPPGSAIILNVSESLKVDEVRFNGVPAVFTRVDPYRVRAIVPALPNGPADVMVFRKDGWRQILPARENYGFRVAERLGEPTFARGDLVIGGLYDGGLPTPFGIVWWLTPQGEVRRMIHLGPFHGADHVFFGAQGFLNVLYGGSAERYDAFFSTPEKGADLLTNAQHAAVRADGGSFLLTEGELRRHQPSGELREKIAMPRASKIDLAADQCTLVVAGSEGLQLFDGCAMRSVATLRGGIWSDARFLPDGSILASDNDGTLLRITTAGAVLYNGNAGGENVRLAIAPDARFAWVTYQDSLGDGRAARFDFATHQLTQAPIELPGSFAATVTVYGEWTAARGEAAYDDAIVIDEVLGFDFPAGAPVEIRGRGWITGAQVTIGGITVTNPVVGGQRITFTMPAGAKSSREVIVRNPNGQRGVFAVPQKGKSKRRAV